MEIQSLKHDEPKEIIVFHAKRDSVCMADDVMAPHNEEIEIEADKKISDLMQKIAEYVPGMEKTWWMVICGSQIIGELVPLGNRKYTIDLKVQDIVVSQLKERNIFCEEYWK